MRARKISGVSIEMAKSLMLIDHLKRKLRNRLSCTYAYLLNLLIMVIYRSIANAGVPQRLSIIVAI